MDVKRSEEGNTLKRVKRTLKRRKWGKENGELIQADELNLKANRDNISEGQVK